MIQNTIIFVILLYLVATNNFCRFFMDQYGLYLVFKKRDFITTEAGFSEREHMKVHRVLKFKDNKTPY
jgi:hypothetical protein